MNKIIIRSRSEVERLNKPLHRKVAIISVRDVDSEEVALKFQPDYLLKLAFDDVSVSAFDELLGRNSYTDEETGIQRQYNMFTNDQAEEICRFYNQIKGKVDVLICQCENGKSRSAAIAAAIMEIINRNGIRIFTDEHYAPNKMVFRKIMSKYHELNKSADLNADGLSRTLMTSEINSSHKFKEILIDDNSILYDIPIDKIEAFMFADGGAMGRPGELKYFCNCDGDLVLYRGNRFKEGIDREFVDYIFAKLNNTREWFHVSLGFGNRLFMKPDYEKDFNSALEKSGQHVYKIYERILKNII